MMGFQHQDDSSQQFDSPLSEVLLADLVYHPSNIYGRSNSLRITGNVLQRILPASNALIAQGLTEYRTGEFQQSFLDPHRLHQQTAVLEEDLALARANVVDRAHIDMEHERWAVNARNPNAVSQQRLSFLPTMPAPPSAQTIPHLQGSATTSSGSTSAMPTSGPDSEEEGMKALELLDLIRSDIYSDSEAGNQANHSHQEVAEDDDEEDDDDMDDFYA
ncbi:hypothetical protein CVT26_002357 [Gymnopilus dilepis]|uniref:Uncharacterized protein n=1 Tax=Gymnopilus dilepis TaxID=231916 RepID=A0A409YN73_9AGAR|nr:hypothetical protein CVT26_002357 [Gymnopilus dilepis]